MNSRSKLNLIENIEKPDLFRNAKILVVDDDQVICCVVSDFLKQLNAQVLWTDRSETAAQWIQEQEFDAILSDIYMPVLKGHDLLAIALEYLPLTPVVLMTGRPTLDNSIDAIRLGAYDYLIKPFNLDILKVTLNRALNYRRLSIDNRDYQIDLEKRVEARTKELSDFLFHSVQSLSLALEARDPYTEGHGQRVAEFVIHLAIELGVGEEHFQTLRLACQLHDIGKIGIPDSILLKKDKLSPIEYDIMKDHVFIGYKILSPIPSLKEVSRYVYEHHERMNGTGYPRGLSKNEIHPHSRMLMVAEVCDALATKRNYKPAWPIQDIIHYFQENADAVYDGEVVKALISILKREGERIIEMFQFKAY
ncbi:MAG: HD domain-containing phosphohydrolase [Candidatus Omnitrophota bacterium]